MTGLTDAITAYFAEANTRPNRALGQNFCIDAAALDDAVSALPLDGAAVVEIGAGLGALTERLLLSSARRVYAIELDAALAARTGARLLCDRLTMVLGDVLELDAGLFPPDALWCGNLPYYITTPIAQLLLSRTPRAMSLMVQQEAADRFFAAPGAKNYGPVAVVTQLYYEAGILRTLGPESYFPQPDVRSCIVGFRKRADAPDIPADALLALVKTCLCMRRKTLLNNLSAYPHAASALSECGLSPAVRGEQLTPAAFLSLYRALAATHR